MRFLFAMVITGGGAAAGVIVMFDLSVAHWVMLGGSVVSFVPWLQVRRDQALVFIWLLT